MIAEEVIQESERFFDYYYDAIQRGLAEERIRPYPIELIGGMLYQNIVAVMNLIAAGSDPKAQNDYIQLGFNIFWDGIKTDEQKEYR